MPRPTKLLPGQEVTVAAFNAEIDRTKKQLSSAVGSTIQSGATGGGITPMQSVQPLWGRLTKMGPEKSPDYYQWEEVYPDKDGKWTAKTGDADTALAPHDSVILEDNYEHEWLINPAVEVNDRKAPLGSVVRLVPTENFVEEGKALEDERDDYWMHRHWLFVWDESLRPFVLAQDVIPAMTTGPGDDTPTYNTSAQAEWLDRPGEFVTLYSEHKAGWPAGDSFISLGYGRGPSAISRGTQGWARYTPTGTRIGTDDDGNPEWRGEWQIVELAAELIQDMEVAGTDVVKSGKIGQANLWWTDRADLVPTDSGYDIVFYNDLFVDLAPDDFVQMRYDRYLGYWIVIAPPIPSGITIYDYDSLQLTTNAYVKLEFQTVMQDTDGDDLEFGLHIERNGGAIKNTSEKDIIGTASWSICAQRHLNPLPVDITGPDAVFQCALYNGGVIATGSQSRSSSSRRRDVTGSAQAVNTNSGSVVCKIKAGEEIDIRIRDIYPTGANDLFSVVGEHSHFTFVEIQGAEQDPGG